MKTLTSILVGASAVATMAAASPAEAATKLYRYSLATGTIPYKYVQPLAGVRPSGPYYRVTTDANGVVTSVEYVRSGNVLTKWDYSYERGGRHPSKSVTHVNGEQVGYSLLSYYPDGKLKRVDSHTPLGKLTGYQTCEPISAGMQKCAGYSAEGKLLGHEEETFDASGTRIGRKHWLEGSDRYHLEVYDPTDGLEREDRLMIFADGRVANIAKTTYDSTGDRIRTDGYTGDGKSWFASIEFKDGLATKKSYNYSSGTTYVAEHRYDADRRRIGSDVTVNGKLAFRFAYVLETDGTVVKTQALGLDGKLWAEYPGVAVDEVDKNGAFRSNPGLAVIYHKEPWW